MHCKGRGCATLASMLLAAGWLAACATGVDTTPGAAAPATDASDEPADDAAAPDSSAPDASDDIDNTDGPGDASSEATDDAELDVGTDVTADVTVDAPEDAEEDAAVPDGQDDSSDGPEDQAVPDTSVDAPEDAAADAQDASMEAEAGPDAPEDATFEAAMDSGCPMVGCDMGTESRDGCANARVMGRKQAAGAGLSVSDSTCQATNADDKVDPACWDSAPDHSYRIYLRQGESLAVTLKPTLSCNSGTWSTALKIYSGASCGDTSCTNKDWCASPVTDQLTQQYTATHEGWVTLVVDGYSAFDAGAYELQVVLACNVPGCEC